MSAHGMWIFQKTKYAVLSELLAQKVALYIIDVDEPIKVQYLRAIAQRLARIRTGSDWIRTESNFGRIRTGSDCNFFENCRIRTGSNWENIFCFNVIIVNISKILVVIRFYRFAKWQCNFAINDKSSAETILPFELYPPLPTYNVEF